MLFLYLLIALTAVAAAIFATPLRRKVCVCWHCWPFPPVP